MEKGNIRKSDLDFKKQNKSKQLLGVQNVKDYINRCFQIFLCPIRHNINPLLLSKKLTKSFKGNNKCTSIKQNLLVHVKPVFLTKPVIPYQQT